MGPFTYSVGGNLYLIVLADCCTGWRGLFSLYKVSAETKAHILTREILSCWVIPAYILLDRDQLFISSESKESCRLWNLQQNLPCHPETKLTESVVPLGSDLHEAVRFFVSLFCAAAERESSRQER